MSDYQDDLTAKRRRAIWREIDRMRARPPGKRPDQVAFSAAVLIICAFIGLLAGIAAAALECLKLLQ